MTWQVFTIIKFLIPFSRRCLVLYLRNTKVVLSWIMLLYSKNPQMKDIGLVFESYIVFDFLCEHIQ
jgi:hypothetical protein